MPRTRVLHLTFDMRIGGAERVIKTLVEIMSDSDFEPSVLCLDDRIGPFGEALAADGYRVDKLARRPGFDWALVLKLRRYLIDQNIDIVHCHQYTPWVYGALASRMTNTRAVFTEHGRFYPDRSSWKRRLVNPVMLRFTDAITAICHATGDALAHYEHIPKGRIQVIYNGIHPLHGSEPGTASIRAELGIPENVTVVGTLARLDPVKNHAMMLHAFKQALIAAPRTFLLIVGDGPERSNLTSLARDLGIEEHVRITGFIENPENHLSSMTVFLLSSLSEGTAMTLLEAMSLGKACVVTNAGGNAELIRDGVDGVVVQSEDADGFAAALVRLLDDSTLASQLGSNAARRFEQCFTANKMYENYDNLYQRICPRGDR